MASKPISVNETLQSEGVQRTAKATAFARHEANKILKFIDEDMLPAVEKKVAARLEAIKVRGFDSGPVTTRRLNELSEALQKASLAGAHGAKDVLGGDLLAFAKAEAEWQHKALGNATFGKWQTVLPGPAQLKHLVYESPLEGRTLGEWFHDLGTDARAKVSRAVRTGVAIGETNEQIMRRIRGTAANQYRDGVLEATRRQAETIVRTTTIASSAGARQLVFTENADLIKGVQWLATLDTRTCPRCGGLDGQTFPVDSGPRPPAHPNCRCTPIPVLPSWEEMGFDAVEGEDADFMRHSMDGFVPSKKTFTQWLEGRSLSDQVQVLGRTRAELFRAGKLELTDFNTSWGKPLTLADLGAVGPTAEELALKQAQAKAAAKAARDKAKAEAAAALKAENEALAVQLAQAQEMARLASAELASAEGTARLLPEDATGWKKISGQKGSNLGGLFEDASGQRWYVKIPKIEDAAHNEILASKLYEMAGVRMPELKLVRAKISGTEGIGVASKWTDGISIGLEPARAAGVKQGFAVDAWLANWDVAGLTMDNVGALGGEAFRIDVGGSILFRAQGTPKGAAFGKVATELDTLRDFGTNAQSAKLFAGMTDAEFVESAAKVASVSDEAIRSAVRAYGPGDGPAKNKLAETLIERKNHVVARAELTQAKIDAEAAQAAKKAAELAEAKAAAEAAQKAAQAAKEAAELAAAEQAKHAAIAAESLAQQEASELLLAKKAKANLASAKSKAKAKYLKPIKEAEANFEVVSKLYASGDAPMSALALAKSELMEKINNLTFAAAKAKKAGSPLYPSFEHWIFVEVPNNSAIAAKLQKATASVAQKAQSQVSLSTQALKADTSLKKAMNNAVASLNESITANQPNSIQMALEALSFEMEEISGAVLAADSSLLAGYKQASNWLLDKYAAHVDNVNLPKWIENHFDKIDFAKKEMKAAKAAAANTPKVPMALDSVKTVMGPSDVVYAKNIGQLEDSVSALWHHIFAEGDDAMGAARFLLLKSSPNEIAMKASGDWLKSDAYNLMGKAEKLQEIQKRIVINVFVSLYELKNGMAGALSAVEYSNKALLAAKVFDALPKSHAALKGFNIELMETYSESVKKLAATKAAKIGLREEAKEATAKAIKQTSIKKAIMDASAPNKAGVVGLHAAPEYVDDHIQWEDLKTRFLRDAEKKGISGRDASWDFDEYSNAIRRWKGGFQGEIRKAQKGKSNNAQADHFARAIDKFHAIYEGGYASQTGLVYRGERWVNGNTDKQWMLDYLQKHDTWEFPYSSGFSSRIETANDFGGSTDLLFQVVGDTSANSIRYDSGGTYREEAELQTRKNARYQILAWDKNENGRVRVTLTEIFADGSRGIDRMKARTGT